MRFLFVFAVLALFLTACPPEDSCPAVDAGVVSDGAVPEPVTPSLTHALCWGDGAGFQRCAVVACRDPFSGSLMVDQNGEPLEPRCGDDGVPACWGVSRPEDGVTAIARGVEYVWCEVPE